MPLTSCSVSEGGSEMWGLGPGTRERPAAECGLFGPATETGADGPEESPHHIWTQGQKVKSDVTPLHSSFGFTYSGMQPC